MAVIKILPVTIAKKHVFHVPSPLLSDTVQRNNGSKSHFLFICALVKEKLLHSAALYLFFSSSFAFACVDAWEKIIACWPLWRSHQSQTVGFQAIIGAGVEVCSRVDSSGKVKVHFIYQDFSSYQTQQWANSGPWNCPLDTRPGPFVSNSAPATLAPRRHIIACTMSVTPEKEKKRMLQQYRALPSQPWQYVFESHYPKKRTSFHKPNIFHPH